MDPGFGGAKFVPSVLPKITQIRDLMRQADRLDDVIIEVDGGVNPQTAEGVIAAGANMLVAGSAVFGSDNYQKAIAALRG